MSKVDRAVHGPSWAEVILGAVLSLLLGVVVGAVLLILKPVAVVKETPKEPVAGTVYYVEGRKGDANQAKQVLAKRKALMEGQSIQVTEDEINSLVASAKAGEKAGEAKAAETVTAGTPNVRLHDGVMQVGVPVEVSVLGVQQRIIAQARGGFEKRGDVFAYEPSEMYFGSCPVQRLPFLASYVREKVLASQNVPEDIAAAWSRLTNVAVEGNKLTLAAQ